MNSLKNTVKNFCKEAGFTGPYSKQSGKATFATDLFRNDVDVDIILILFKLLGLVLIDCMKK